MRRATTPSTAIRADQNAAVVEQVEFARELTGLEQGDHGRRRDRAVIDLDRPLLDQEEVGGTVVTLEQGSERGQLLDATERAHSRRLVGAQRGKGLLVASIRVGGIE